MTVTAKTGKEKENKKLQARKAKTQKPEKVYVLKTIKVLAFHYFGLCVPTLQLITKKVAHTSKVWAEL